MNPIDSTLTTPARLLKATAPSSPVNPPSRLHKLSRERYRDFRKALIGMVRVALSLISPPHQDMILHVPFPRVSLVISWDFGAHRKRTVAP